MKIEVRNVKHAAFASEETICFEATVYIDGVKAGTASNEGHGGCNRYHPHSLGERLEAYAKTLPETDSNLVEDDGKPIMIQPDADCVIGDILSDALLRRDLQRLLKTKVVCQRGGKIYTTKRVSADQLRAMLSDPALLTKLNAEQVLNAMPFDDAVSLYRKLAA
jgi:hypothetical protein